MGRFVSGISRQDDASESWRLGSVSCPRWRGADKRQAEAARMKVLKRNGVPAGQDPSRAPSSPSDAEPYHGITLSAEEIKDMVCSTGLWLVVREGFGGVGRVSRKGDGWRIRA